MHLGIAAVAQVDLLLSAHEAATFSRQDRRPAARAGLHRRKRQASDDSPSIGCMGRPYWRGENIEGGPGPIAQCSGYRTLTALAELATRTSSVPAAQLVCQRRPASERWAVGGIRAHQIWAINSPRSTSKRSGPVGSVSSSRSAPRRRPGSPRAGRVRSPPEGPVLQLLNAQVIERLAAGAAVKRRGGH